MPDYEAMAQRIKEIATPADISAIAGDWRAVGDDLRAAIARERGRLAVEVFGEYRDDALAQGKTIRVQAFDAYIDIARREAE